MHSMTKNISRVNINDIINISSTHMDNISSKTDKIKRMYKQYYTMENNNIKYKNGTEYDNIEDKIENISNDILNMIKLIKKYEFIVYNFKRCIINSIYHNIFICRYGNYFFLYDLIEKNSTRVIYNIYYPISEQYIIYRINTNNKFEFVMFIKMMNLLQDNYDIDVYKNYYWDLLLSLPKKLNGVGYTVECYNWNFTLIPKDTYLIFRRKKFIKIKISMSFKKDKIHIHTKNKFNNHFVYTKNNFGELLKFLNLCNTINMGTYGCLYNNKFYNHNNLIDFYKIWHTIYTIKHVTSTIYCNGIPSYIILKCDLDKKLYTNINFYTYFNEYKYNIQFRHTNNNCYLIIERLFKNNKIQCVLRGSFFEMFEQMQDFINNIYSIHGFNIDLHVDIEKHTTSKPKTNIL